MGVMRKANEFKTILDGGDYQWLEGDNVREVLESAGITRDDIGNNSEWWEVDHLFVKDYEGERREIWGYNAHGGMVPEKATFWLLWKDGRKKDLSLEVIHVEEVDMLLWEDLTDEERKELAWEDNREERIFLRYRDWCYSMNEFMRFDYGPGKKHGENQFYIGHPYNGWHAYKGDSLFSGVLIKVIDGDDEHLIVGLSVC